MNIFVLDNDLEKAAQFHVDKHIVKMPLETAQLLCTAHHVSGSKNLDKVPYKSTHRNHPCASWIRESLSNYVWLCELGIELCKEYSYRYGKVHGCEKVIKWCQENKPYIKDVGITQFAQAMPDKYKSKNVVDSYRKYYLSEKKNLFSWKNRGKPCWVETV